MRVARDDVHLFFACGLSIPTRTIYCGEVAEGPHAKNR